MGAPEQYVAWINSHLGFNPRAQQSSDALSSFVVDDLVSACPPLAADLEQGRVLRKLNAAVGTRITERNVDLVLADAAATGVLGVVRLAVENKTVMTAHYDGVNAAKLVVGPPSPQPGEPAHYDAFLLRLGRLYEERFHPSKTTS